jgi:hypothetical protein
MCSICVKHREEKIQEKLRTWKDKLKKENIQLYREYIKILVDD